MEMPVQITFRDMASTPTLEATITEHAARLEKFSDRIIRCRVVVEAPHKHHHKGKIFHVRIDLTIPGHEFIVNRDPSANHAHEDIYVAIRDAFDAAARQLDEYVRKQRG